MNNKDLLYSNKFSKDQNLTPKEIHNDSRNYYEYENAKLQEINNVQSYLETAKNTRGTYTQQKLKAQGWDKGTLGNQQPLLNSFTQDIVSDHYDRKKISYVSIDSSDRNHILYLKPNNFEIYLGKEYSNVESLKIIEHNFINMFFPINVRNNKFIFFLPGDDIVTKVIKECKLCDINQSTCAIKDDKIPLVDIGKFVYAIEVPSGFYSVDELSNKMEAIINSTPYMDSDFYVNTDYNNIQYPLNFTICINPITHHVDIISRKENFKIKAIRTRRGYNEIEFDLDLPSYASPDELNLFLNQKEWNVIPIGFPTIGGIPADTINKKAYEWRDDVTEKYFTISSAGEAGSYILHPKSEFTLVPNEFILANKSEEITDPEILAKASIGREQPFAPFYSGDQYILDFFTKDAQEAIKTLLYNEDCSSNSILQLLGWPKTSLDAVVTSITCQLAPMINNYTLFSQNNYAEVLNNVYLNNIFEKQINFLNMTPTMQMPIVLSSSGKYFFRGLNYVFIKLVPKNNNPSLLSGNFLKATANISGQEGKESLYRNTLSQINGIYVSKDYAQFVDNVITNNVEGSKLLHKDTNNIFTKITLSTLPNNFENGDQIVVDNIYFNYAIQSLDTLIVQIIDKDGRLVDIKSDFNFTLEIEETIDTLKGTFINSRTGSVLRSGRQKT